MSMITSKQPVFAPGGLLELIRAT